MTTRLRAGSATEVGRVRSVNQDSKLLTDGIYAVADGMGGHQGGEVASALAIEVLDDAVIEPTVESLLEAAQAANAAVFEKASEKTELTGMGTTLCALQLVEAGDDEEIAWVSVGDSRIYLFRDGTLIQLTTDHSLVEDLRRDGQLTDEEAAIHPQRNILTRALGIDPDVVIDAKTVIPYRDDRYLICSDGLFNEVQESLMAATLRRIEDPDEAAAELVRLANEHGGRDNITCVIVDVIDDGGRSEAASKALAASEVVSAERGERTSQEAGKDGAPGDEVTSVVPRTADADGTDDRTAYSTPAVPRQGDDDLWDRAVPGSPEDHFSRGLGRGRVKHLTWRVLAFVFALLVIAGAAVGAIGYFARNTYYVGYRGDLVTIYKGTPSGELWFKPTVERTTQIARTQVPVEYRDDVAKGKKQPSLGKALDYVQNLRTIIDQRATATPVTPPTTAPTSAPVGPTTATPPAAPATTPP